jgi:hypothetical protein
MNLKAILAAITLAFVIVRAAMTIASVTVQPTSAGDDGYRRGRREPLTAALGHSEPRRSDPSGAFQLSVRLVMMIGPDGGGWGTIIRARGHSSWRDQTRFESRRSANGSSAGGLNYIRRVLLTSRR